VGKDAISPSTFADFHTPKDFARFANDLREQMDGIPIGFKLSANHIGVNPTYALPGANGSFPHQFGDVVISPSGILASKSRSKRPNGLTWCVNSGLNAARSRAVIFPSQVGSSRTSWIISVLM